jgi:hypothetical protein
MIIFKVAQNTCIAHMQWLKYNPFITGRLFSGEGNPVCCPQLKCSWRGKRHRISDHGLIPTNDSEAQFIRLHQPMFPWIITSIPIMSRQYILWGETQCNQFGQNMLFYMTNLWIEGVVWKNWRETTQKKRCTSATTWCYDIELKTEVTPEPSTSIRSWC